MPDISKRRALARAAAVALGLAALYGTLTALVVWISDSASPVFHGGLVAGGTAVLAALCLATIWSVFNEGENAPFESTGPLTAARIIFGLLLLVILVLPFVILTGGYLAYWLVKEPKREEE
jgi:hypothetical protein